MREFGLVECSLLSIFSIIVGELDMYLWQYPLLIASAMSTSQKIFLSPQPLADDDQRIA